MVTKLKKFIKRCPQCQKNKIGKSTKCPMRITTTAKFPFEKIFLDIVGPLPQTHNGNKYILTMQDDLSKFSIGIPLPNQETSTVAKAFVVNFICKFGAPISIVTDQGSNFMSAVFKEVCKNLKIKKINTSAYHPQSNGALERSHRTLAEYVRNFSSDDPNNWDEWIPFAIFSYNSSPHSSTNYMPFELVYGFKPNIPTSLKHDPEPLYNHDDYSAELKFRLQYSWNSAQKTLIDKKLKSKESYDINATPVKFEIGDKVLIKNESSTKTKLSPLWLGPYNVINTNSPENSTIKIDRRNKVVHNNRLKLFEE